MIGRLSGMLKNRDGEWVISFSTREDFREEYDELDGKDVTVEIKKYNRKRSLDANAFAWKMIDQIAKKMHMKKSFVYRMAIRDLAGVSETVCVQTEKAQSIKRWWEAKGLGWQVDEFPSKIEGCTNLTLYCGSSAYDTTQMSGLIDSLIQEAEGLGIPTMTQEMYDKMLADWGRKKASD